MKYGKIKNILTAENLENNIIRTEEYIEMGKMNVSSINNKEIFWQYIRKYGDDDYRYAHREGMEKRNANAILIDGYLSNIQSDNEYSDIYVNFEVEI